MFSPRNNITLSSLRGRKAAAAIQKATGLLRFARNDGSFLFKFLIIFFFLNTSLYALPSDKDQPIHIISDNAHLNKKLGNSIFIGHVKLTQGTSILTTPKLTVFTDKKNQLQKALAEGAGTTYETITDLKKPPFIATAQSIEYSPPDNKIILIGNAKTVQGSNSYSAPQIEYHIDQEMVVSPSSKQGRTTIIITPQSFKK
jgi:lipopolysaccharide export system protein LptA